MAKTRKKKSKDNRPDFSYNILLQLQDHRCFYCNKRIASEPFNDKTCRNGYTRDHFFPRSWGNGLYGNTVLACEKCNRKKGSRMPERDEIIRFDQIWSQIYPGPSIDLTEFFVIQRFIDKLERLVGVRVDTANII